MWLTRVFVLNSLPYFPRPNTVNICLGRLSSICYNAKTVKKDAPLFHCRWPHLWPIFGFDTCLAACDLYNLSAVFLGTLSFFHASVLVQLCIRRNGDNVTHSVDC